ncbi:hypothetical protein BY996DRAFT_6412793 [Phakopsora pachyrhizi]|nr:hypothetical protein BY996DRAFT_6412793 [Phakopsora pachyrhizi]
MLRCMDFYFIAFTILLIFETSFESTASTTSGLIFLRRGGKKNVLYHNQQLERSSFSGSDNDRTDLTNDPSVTSASSESKTYIRLAGDHMDPLKIKRRSEPANRDYQQSFMRKKVHGYLKELLEGVQARHRNINEICATKVTQYNAQKVGWKILAELKAILALCLACASRIKGYATSPAPSGIPTPRGGRHLQANLSTIVRVQRMLQKENLIQISEALSACLNVTGGKLDLDSICWAQYLMASYFTDKENITAVKK